MKRSYVPLALVLLASVSAGAEQLVPAGSSIQCMISDKISSKTTNVGDPVICQASHEELYGRSVLPYGSYMIGHFEEYKDPGHFVGKGWMELKFDRLIVGNDTVIPIETRVIATSDKYPVDSQGRIHGTGHPVRDTVEWMIPVLWPIDLINLPRRGPSPVLKPETRLTVKLLDDVGIPTKQEVQHQPELVSRFNYSDPTPAPIEREQPPAPVQQQYAPAPVQQQYQPAPIQQAYAQPSPTVVVVQASAPAPPTIIQQQVVQQRRPMYYPYPVYPVSPYGYYPAPAYRYYAPYPY